MAQVPEKIVDSFTRDLLKKIGIKASVKTEDAPEAIKVSISGDNLGALIGYHGETLESLQLILSLVLSNQVKEGEWKRVLLDIGSWRAERLNSLETMISKAVENIRAQRLERIGLPPMSANQRREVHLIVAEKYPDLDTESEGEEPNRRVIIFAKRAYDEKIKGFHESG